jgi:hypothetical protein
VTGRTILSRASLPLAPWRGRAVLVFRRTAWFDGGSDQLIGLTADGLCPSPRGLELDGPLPPLRPGMFLAFDGLAWALEGTGTLEGVDRAPDTTVRLEPWLSPAVPPAGWCGRWEQWMRAALPRDSEGRWLRSLREGPGKDWERLIGCGSGSTPSGDDYLGGWLAAQWRRDFLTPETVLRLTRALGRTARLSRHYLSHLADGRVDRTLGAVLAGLPEPDSPEVRALTAQGDLSGRATLLGLIAGLSAGGPTVNTPRHSREHAGG